MAETRSSDIVTRHGYLTAHGTHADHDNNHYHLGYPGAVGAGLGPHNPPPGFGWRGVLPKSPIM